VFNHTQPDIFIPDAVSVKEAIKRTTHLAVSAHQDDLEMMAIDGILYCFDHPNAFFTGVVMTDGRGSPRSAVYASLSDDEMMHIRALEQRKAAYLGNYSALVSYAYPSQHIKDKAKLDATDDLVKLLNLAKPNVVYTHNLADKHPTHVAVAVRVVNAIRQMAPSIRPEKLLGCEVWRGLDWLPDQMKVTLDCSTRLHLQEALLGVYDSQISGGKRYDLAALGRRRANATFHQSHDVDEATHLTFAMDLTPLIEDDALDVVGFINEKILQFQTEVVDLLKKYL
jgi:LmbE family N-acetylglucosaminyl deacetylase